MARLLGLISLTSWIYQSDYPVTLWVNKVGPYNNPQETYNYYSLPFCHQSSNAAHKWGGLGEVLVCAFLLHTFQTTCLPIVGAYFLLNAENYPWQWTSFFSAASTAVYVYLYSIYYYAVKTKMSGFFQTSFYFGYTLMFCLGLGILCGAIGYLGSNLFVRRIYQNIKCD
ncbi:transmembrane 9 superfamily member 1-like [Rhododendron vialii]|uniref:transmembrane 9 superfamily member 1-like n=1 Tax=Rhododendron vialii TaxID=182163 RepID=UPI00265E3F0D|nr:transmembrane 9 superfamily member 1-like [Rhododendron vialii]